MKNRQSFAKCNREAWRAISKANNMWFYAKAKEVERSRHEGKVDRKHNRQHATCNMGKKVPLRFTVRRAKKKTYTPQMHHSSNSRGATS